MPSKKPAAGSAEPPVESPSDAPVADTAEEKKDAAPLRKLPAHPSSTIMVKEALKELDSRKGVSSQAIQNYIRDKYPSVDLMKLKYLVRGALKRGLESGTLVRPAKSREATGIRGKFRLAPKIKESMIKNENMDPNVQKASKSAKDGAKKAKQAGATKTDSKEQTTSQEPPKKSKKAEGAATSKGAPEKKPKAKTAAEKGGEGRSKAAKAGKVSKTKAAQAGSDAPASKATGKQGKKTAE